MPAVPPFLAFDDVEAPALSDGSRPAAIGSPWLTVGLRPELLFPRLWAGGSLGRLGRELPQVSVEPGFQSRPGLPVGFHRRTFLRRGLCVCAHYYAAKMELVNRVQHW